jgi:hypothetical protein
MRLFFALLLTTAVWAQTGAEFSTGLLRNPDMPQLELMLANHPAGVIARREGVATLTAPGSDVRLAARSSREGPFEFCRIRHAPDSSLAPEELKLVWSFPMSYNESMTLDADALEGHPLYLPDGTIPPAHHLNWGTLFYNRARNFAIGTTLRGAPPLGGELGRAFQPNERNAIALLD